MSFAAVIGGYDEGRGVGKVIRDWTNPNGPDTGLYDDGSGVLRESTTSSPSYPPRTSRPCAV